MSTELRQALEQVARRFRQVRLWSGLALCWLALGPGRRGLLAAGRRCGPIRCVARWVVAAAGAGLGRSPASLVALRSARDPRWVARRIEAKHPELDTGLLAAVERDRAPRPGRLGFLQTAVIREALEHHRSHDWDETVPTWTLRGRQAGPRGGPLRSWSWSSIVLVGQALAGRSAAPGARRPAADASDVEVEPGNTEIERGTLAAGRRPLPRGRAGRREPGRRGRHPGPGLRTPMTRSLEDPTFAGRVESVDTDLAYRVEFDGREHRDLSRPRVRVPRARAHRRQLVFPAYTALEPKTVEDIRHVTAVEGTELTLLCRLNKDVATAQLVDEKGQAIALDAGRTRAATSTARR